ncbi:alkaline-phosphatase-like protein [Pavlovales sp. CCMP2436]|nr:alkaline-phosphatase-like protein [Pavlovales sp. CCMP2436]
MAVSSQSRACGCACLLALVTLAALGSAPVTVLQAPLALLAHLTGLTVATPAFNAWVTMPPPELPTATSPTPADAPNVLLYLVDDLGYGDVRVFAEHARGKSNMTTPMLDKLAADGLMLTQFITQPICTPARAALLTSHMPQRYGLAADVLPQRVLFTPGSPADLPRSELTLATVLKTAGYVTGMGGKWHLGVSAVLGQSPAHRRRKRSTRNSASGTQDQADNRVAFMPAMHGLDDSLVFPFSNLPSCDPYGSAASVAFCMLVANTTIVQQPARMLDLSRNILEHAARFIRRAESAKQKWLYYYADVLKEKRSPRPHSTCAYMVVSEIDSNVGELLAVLDSVGAAERTLVIFMSDNGPYLEDGYANSGTTGGLKGGKGQMWEGGIRVPAIVRWPGTIPTGFKSDAPVSMLDILPTIAALAGVHLPARLPIDGVSQAEFLRSGGKSYANPWARDSTALLRRRRFPSRLAARHKSYKIFWATQRWPSATTANASAIGVYDVSVCVECCPKAGWTSGLFGSATVCQCSLEALQFHDPPLVFDMSKDRNETTPIPSTGELYSQVREKAEEAWCDFDSSRAVERGGREDWCANCMLPLPLNIWPCCGCDRETAASVARRKPECSGAANTARAAAVAAWATKSPDRVVAELMNCLPHGAAANLTSAAGGGAVARALAGTLCTCNWCTAGPAGGACPADFV